MTSDLNRERIVAAFLAESEEGLQLMEQCILAAESDPNDGSPLDDIFRVAHTIKGNASLLDFTELTGFAHVVEDLLDRLRSKQLPFSGDVVSLTLASVDAFRALLLAASEGHNQLTVAQQELKEKISRRAENAKANSSSADFREVSSPLAVAGSTNQGERYRTLRVEVSKLDRMMNLASEISIIHGRLCRLIEESATNQSKQDVLEMHRESDRLHRELQEQIMGARMVPVGPLFQQLMRAVRDIARSQNKLARLEVAGGDVEVDTRVLEHLRDPLLHMIRNAVDHGIETKERRIACQKNACGVLQLSASHVAGNIVIRLSDDGAGFNRARILEKAVALGLVEDGETPSDPEILRLVFNSGFSTAAEVTELSGRGVGMDVVRRNIESLRGSIDVESEEGAGSTITLRLPLTLAIIEGFSVASGNETYVIPLESVSECLDLPDEYIESDTGGVISLRGEPLPFVQLSDALGSKRRGGSRQSVVVVEYGECRAGLAVDQLLGESQAIIKPLDRMFQKVSGVSGATILADGRVALILDINTLMRDTVTQRAGTVD